MAKYAMITRKIPLDKYPMAMHPRSAPSAMQRWLHEVFYTNPATDAYVHWLFFLESSLLEHQLERLSMERPDLFEETDWFRQLHELNTIEDDEYTTASHVETELGPVEIDPSGSGYQIRLDFLIRFRDAFGLTLPDYLEQMISDRYEEIYYEAVLF